MREGVRCEVCLRARDPAGRFRGRGGSCGPRGGVGTAPRRSAQHGVAPGAFVLHHLQRAAQAEKNLSIFGYDPKKRSAVLTSRVVATAASQRYLKRAREPMCHAPCCVAGTTAIESDGLYTQQKIWAFASWFFRALLTRAGTGGALESDGTAASSFPVVPGFLGLPEALNFLSPSGGQSDV